MKKGQLFTRTGKITLAKVVPDVYCRCTVDGFIGNAGNLQITWAATLKLVLFCSDGIVLPGAWGTTMCTSCSFPKKPPPLCSPYCTLYYSPAVWWNKCEFPFPGVVTWICLELVHQLNMSKGPPTAPTCSLSRSHQYRLSWKPYPEQLQGLITGLSRCFIDWVFHI